MTAALAERTIDAAPGSAWMLPWQAHERGIVLKSFNPATNYRVEYYGDSLFTLRHFANAEPAVVSQFRASFAQGLGIRAAAPRRDRRPSSSPNPLGPAARGGGRLGTSARYQIDVARRLARYPDIRLLASFQPRSLDADRGGDARGGGAGTKLLDLTGFIYNLAPPSPEERVARSVLAMAARIMAR